MLEETRGRESYEQITGAVTGTCVQQDSPGVGNPFPSSQYQSLSSPVQSPSKNSGGPQHAEILPLNVRPLDRPPRLQPPSLLLNFPSPPREDLVQQDGPPADETQQGGHRQCHHHVWPRWGPRGEFDPDSTEILKAMALAVEMGKAVS